MILVPTIHLNGTSRDELLNVHVDAMAALAKAICVVAKTAPNGRDFYVQGNDALHKAQVEHADRIGRLNAVLQDLGAIVEGIAEQR